MSAKAIRPYSYLNFPAIFIVVLLLHLFLLMIQGVDLSDFRPDQVGETTPLKIRSIRTVGVKKSDSKNLPLTSAPEPAKRPTAAKELSFSDLSVNPSPIHSVPQVAPVRPGSRPDVMPRRKNSLAGISLKGKEIERFARESKSAAFAGHQTPGLSSSDVSINLEVPEGVDPDELNEYELMFYGFQKRVAINYVNAFYKNLDKFQRENPHLTFPMTDTKQVMTGRLTYDEKGNIKQIKMVRWTNDQKLQDFFEKVMKTMDTLHNPPKALWETSGEFSIFFTLVLNG